MYSKHKEREVNRNTWIIFGVVVIALLGGLIFTSKKEAVSVGDVDVAKIQTAKAESGNIADHVFGKADAKVTLIEYGDFQCPGCASAFPTLKELSEEYKDQIAFVFRNNPLPTLHPNARAAAAAAEAAGLQGKYWEMHDKLYEEQTNWSSLSVDERLAKFTTYATVVGVTNIDKFKADLDSEPVKAKINYDLALGKKAEVTGTPTILLNNQKVESDVWSDKAKFKQAIEDALK